MPDLRGDPLVEVTRNGKVESVHHVAACALDARGKILLERGDIDVPVYLRSTAKPFIAAAIVEAGAREAFGLEPHEIALIAGSHSGEPFHIAAVRTLLSKIGMDETALQCGPQPPHNESIYNNCSGKHAGILALCKLIGADTETYLEAVNPAQVRILAFCARLTGDDPQTWPVGIDGCGIPTFATSLRHGATAFARFATLRDLGENDARALQIVRDAMLAHPEYVAGPGEFDTELMRVAAGAIVCKAGAEGVQGVAVIGPGYGFVSKVLDGSARARSPLTVEALRAFEALSPSALTELAPFAKPVVYNRAGRAVGSVRCRNLRS